MRGPYCRLEAVALRAAILVYSIKAFSLQQMVDTALERRLVNETDLQLQEGSCCKLAVGSTYILSWIRSRTSRNVFGIPRIPRTVQ